MISAFLLAVVAVSTQDPRPALVDLQLQGLREAALARADEAELADPEAADQWGLDYLRGHLLEALHQEGEAPAAFVSAMVSTPRLAAYGRYRLALNQYRVGHPEVAAGLLANLLANQPPPALVAPAVRYLADSLSLGGDCRLLAELDSWLLPPPQLRELELSRARCDLLQGKTRRGRSSLIRLLQENPRDEAARGAADLLSQVQPDPEDDTISLLLGMAFYHLGPLTRPSTKPGTLWREAISGSVTIRPPLRSSRASSESRKQRRMRPGLCTSKLDPTSSTETGRLPSRSSSRPMPRIRRVAGLRRHSCRPCASIGLRTTSKPLSSAFDSSVTEAAGDGASQEQRSSWRPRTW